MAYPGDLFVTKKRLTEWGYWCYKIATQGLGYSGQSIIAKLQRDGGIMAAGTSLVTLPSNEQAEEINNLIERLAQSKPAGENKPKWATVIRIHYTMSDKSIKDRTRLADMNERTYYRYLRDAQHWLSKHITAY